MRHTKSLLVISGVSILFAAAVSSGACSSSSGALALPPGASLLPSGFDPTSVPLPTSCSGETYYQATSSLCPSPGPTYFLCDGTSYVGYDCSNPGSPWTPANGSPDGGTTTGTTATSTTPTTGPTGTTGTSPTSTTVPTTGTTGSSPGSSGSASSSGSETVASGSTTTPLNTSSGTEPESGTTSSSAEASTSFHVSETTTEATETTVITTASTSESSSSEGGQGSGTTIVGGSSTAVFSASSTELFTSSSGVAFSSSEAESNSSTAVFSSIAGGSSTTQGFSSSVGESSQPFSSSEAVSTTGESTTIGSGTTASSTASGLPCGSDLSNISTRDFRISFTIQTTQTHKSFAAVNQRDVCGGGGSFWDVRIQGGRVVIETDSPDNAIQGCADVADGDTHEIIIQRVLDVVTIYVDGLTDGTGSSIANWAALPVLEIGTDPCDGSDGTVPFNNAKGTITNVCVSPGSETVVSGGDSTCGGSSSSTETETTGGSTNGFSSSSFTGEPG